MPFRAPGIGVLAPRPSFQSQQAMAANVHPSNNAFDTSAIYAALQSTGVPHHPPSNSN
jgi:hypothetical protein